MAAQAASRWKTYPGKCDVKFEQWANLPSHWKQANLSKISNRITDGSHFSPETQDEGKNYISVKDIDEWGRIDFENCKKISQDDFIRLSHDGNKPIPGSLLITKDGTIGRATIVRESDDFVILSSVGLIEPNESVMLTPFLRYFLISKVGVEQMYSMIAGSALTRLTVEKINWLRAPIPPVSEQASIVRFIDSFEDNYKQLFYSLESQLRALGERRSALITQAVTKGLNPDVPMRDSTIDLFGEIPSHWEINRLVFNASTKGRIGWRGLKADEYVDDGYAFLSTPDIKSGFPDYSNINRIEEWRYLESPEIMLEKHDVLLTKDGSTTGTVAFVNELPEPTTVNSSIAVIRCRSKIKGEFLFRYFASAVFQHHVKLLLGGMGVPHLFQKDIKKIPILIPPLEEQQEIVEYLESKLSVIDVSISHIANQIAKLNQYRAALISAAVTGKIDVRGLA